jgi:hypothetical protein
MTDISNDCYLYYIPTLHTSVKRVTTIISLLFSSYIYAQSFASIKLIDATTKKPIKGEYVEIISDNDTYCTIGETDHSGIYKIDFIPTKEKIYQVNITVKGYQTVRRDVNLFTSGTILIPLHKENISFKKKSGLVYVESSIRGFGNYVPKTPKTLKELPDSVREKLTQHLLNRLGKDFYSKLNFAGGQIVDIKRLYIVNTNAKNYKWTPYSYYLWFAFTDVKQGIGLFSAQIILDSSGNVIEEIELPEISKNSEKKSIVSLQEAKNIARKNGFSPESCEISMEYNTEISSLVWSFRKYINDNGLTFEILSLKIDAHLGKVIGIDKGSGIR